MTTSFDVIVVGLGAMGSAACYHLARRGVRVLGLEQFDIPHGQGSSHGYSRMIRLAYFEHADYVPLLREAFTLWQRLESDSGQKLLHLTGGLYMGPRGGEMIAGSSKSAREHHLPHTMLTAEQLMRRFSQFQIPADYQGMFEENAGFLLPEKAIAAHAEGALRAGAELHGRETVRGWHAGDGHVTVTADRGTYRASKLLFCGGSWTGKLVADLRIPLVVTRQVFGWVWPKKPNLFELGRLPVWAIDHNDGSLHYGFPMIADAPGFKIAHHRPGQATDPDTLDRGVLPGDEETFRPILTKFIPEADGPLLSLRVCMYTNSPDGHFIVDRHPQEKNILLACGFSGHGFKFASVIGKALADLASEEGTDLPVEFLGLKRFS